MLFNHLITRLALAQPTETFISTPDKVLVRLINMQMLCMLVEIVLVGLNWILFKICCPFPSMIVKFSKKNNYISSRRSRDA